jgi:hypothetical protein
MIMEQLSPIGSKIAAAFVKAQLGFGKALKTSTNPHFRSRYADLSACVEAVIDALNTNGIGLLQRTYESKDGVMVETVFIHESGEVIEGGLLHVPASKQDAQGYGSALTYARRYSLLAATGLAPEDDDGNAASRKSNVNASVMADHLLAIQDSGSSEELTKAYNDAYAACDGDATWQAKVIAAKKARVERAQKGKSK